MTNEQWDRFVDLANADRDTLTEAELAELEHLFYYSEDSEECKKAKDMYQKS
jgi:hypothetical protein